jgi:hypothetical protein
MVVSSHGSARRAQACAALGLVLAPALLGGTSCSLDNLEPAPYLAPPTAAGECGTTDTLLPQLLAFVRADGVAPLREVLERLSDARGELSLRTLLSAVVRLVSSLGLDRTATAVKLASTDRALDALEPLAETALALATGRADGQDRYDALEAVATLVDECPADDLLTALDGLVRFEVGPPEARRRWIALLSEDVSPLLQDPALEPLLESFEGEAQRGKPAVLALLGQILTFVADPTFRIERVETLLESALYPLVSMELRAKVERLVLRLEEITAPEVDVLPPLQRALACMNARPATRTALLGLVYDLITVDQLDLAGLLAAVDGVVSEADGTELLDFVSGVLVVLRDDRVVQRQILGLVEVLLRRPDVEGIAPMLLELLEADVGSELLGAVGRLLEGCGR